MADIIIRNAMIMQTEAPFEIIEGADVVIEGSMITAAGKGAAAGLSAPKEIDGSGKIVIPGNVCAHHHYYSGLSRGMLISSGPQTDFIQVLKEWWWRLDRALDEEAVYYSSLVCSLDAIAAGTTSCIDHHASPSFIRNSLSAIAKGMEDAGVRGATCFEITDRNRGMDEIREGYDENVRFASEVDGRKARGEDVLVEAMIGGHAPFTIPDEGLALMADAVEKTGRGMHLHVAEDKYDQVWSHHFHGDDIIRRLDRFSLLDERTLLVHGVHLSSEEVSILNDRGCFLAHNARSNMNNHIGYNHYVQDVKKLVIGTDGCGGDMFEELKLAFFKHKDEGGPFWPSDFVAALNRGNRLVESVFRNGSKWGRIGKGYKADLAILSYNAPTPVVSSNAATHFVWGMSSGNVESTIIDGKLLYENRKFTSIDADRIYKEAQCVAKRVWERTDRIKA